MTALRGDATGRRSGGSCRPSLQRGVANQTRCTIDERGGGEAGVLRVWDGVAGYFGIGVFVQWQQGTLSDSVFWHFQSKHGQINGTIAGFQGGILT